MCIAQECPDGARTQVIPVPSACRGGGRGKPGRVRPWRDRSTTPYGREWCFRHGIRGPQKRNPGRGRGSLVQRAVKDGEVGGSGRHRGGGIHDPVADRLVVAAREGTQRALEDRLDLGRGQRGAGHRLHQRHDGRHVRRRHRGARHAGVVLGGRILGAGVAGGHDQRRAIRAVSAGRGHVDRAAVVGVAGPGARLVARRHVDHVAAACRGEPGGIRVAVARGHHDRRAARHGGIDGVLVAARAGTAATQRHVDDLGRVGIGRNAGHAAARGPDDAVDDVGGVAAAAAQDADRHDLRAIGAADHAVVVVAHRGDRARHVRAVPAGRILAVVVARVVRIGVASVAIAGDAAVADEVVALQQVRAEVGVVRVAGVEHRDDHARTAGGVPGLVGPDAARARLHAPQVRAVMGVVGRHQRLHDPVDLDVHDVRVGGDLAHHALRFHAVQRPVRPNDGAPDGQGAQAVQPDGLAGGVGGPRQVLLLRGGVGAVAVLDDELVKAGLVGRSQARGVHAAGGGDGTRDTRGERDGNGSGQCALMQLVRLRHRDSTPWQMGKVGLHGNRCPAIGTTWPGRPGPFRR